jgi:DNA-binding response OmpR family regulator
VGKEQDLAILIVEDQTVIALDIEVIRGIGGGFVGYAARVSDALALIETISWDAALLDIRLTQDEMVYPVAERLRAHGIPFAFVTAWEGPIDPRYCDAPTLRKPYSQSELRNLLAALIEGAATIGEQ